MLLFLSFSRTDKEEETSGKGQKNEKGPGSRLMIGRQRLASYLISIPLTPPQASRHGRESASAWDVQEACHDDVQSRDKELAFAGIRRTRRPLRAS